MADSVDGSEGPRFLLHCLGRSLEGKCSPSQEMLASVWSRLPEKMIFDLIVVRLPQRSLARFRAVAKLWRARLSSAAAKELLALPLCALRLQNPYAGNISLGIVPPLESVNADITLDLSFLPDFYHGCQDYDVGGGLVCFTAGRAQVWRFCVVNPMTREYQELPPLPQPPNGGRYHDPVVRLCVETASPLSFRVLAVCNPYKLYETTAGIVFSSATGRWEELWRPGDGHPAFNQIPYRQFVISRTTVVAAYGDVREIYVYRDGDDGIGQGKVLTSIDPPGYSFSTQYHIMHILDQVYLVEDRCMKIHLDWGTTLPEGFQLPDVLSVKLLKLDGETWREECVMPSTIGGRSLKVENAAENLTWEYRVGHAAVVKNAICLTIGRKRDNRRQARWPKHYMSSSVVLYHPESKSWELVEHNVMPDRCGDSHKLFQPSIGP